MPGKYWYYGLVVISFVILFVALQHRREWKLLVLQLFVASVIHPVELVILTTNGYTYLPGITDTNTDVTLGAYISNFLIVPATAVLISAFSLSWRYQLVSAVLFTGIDWFFTSLGIYQHFWWKSIYTGIGLLILYQISGFLWRQLLKPKHSFVFQLLSIYLAYFALQSALTFALNQGGELFILQMASSQLGPLKTMSILSSLYQVIIGVLITLFIGIRMRFRYRLLNLCSIFLINWLLDYAGIFVSNGDFAVQHLLVVPLVATIIVSILFNKAGLSYLFP
ncbi:hypothetical protein HA075_06020 [bacterium BFN5]|nr:hypothetical protein HA075_05785 [bacterium BFN5]QJW45442.1 hypothetical protein HA075_06020 [bacterium BFN5]